jgi:hypothetical protein
VVALSRERLRLISLGIAIFAGLWALASGHLYSIDGLEYFRGGTRLAFAGSLLFDPPLRWGEALLTAPNGPVGLSLIYVPALLPLIPWSGLQPPVSSLPYDQRLLYGDPIWLAVSWVQPAIVALTGVLVAIAVRRSEGGPRLSIAAGFAYAFATPLLHYGRADFTQPLSALLLLAATMLALRAHDGLRDHTWLAVGVLTLGVLTRPVDGALAAALAGAVALWPGGGAPNAILAGPSRRPSLRFAALVGVGVTAGFTLSLAVNWLRHGHALDFGYGSQGFTMPLPVGLLAYLVSPGKAIVWYAPIAFLVPWGARALWRRGRVHEMVALAVPCVVWLLVYSTWQGLGGWAWGPRFLVTTMPLIVILAALAATGTHSRTARVAFGALALAGLAANATQLFVDPLQTVWGIYGDNVYPSAAFWRQFEPGAFQPFASLAFLHVDRISDLLDVVWLRAAKETGGISLVFGLTLAVTALVATLAACGVSRHGWGPGRPEAERA